MDDIFLNHTAAVASAWRGLRAQTGLRLREVACVGAARTLLLAEWGDPGLPVVTISAGMHGDEPGGVWALYSLVRDGLLDPRFSYRIWPCFNPAGFDARTRTNAEGVDINRSFERGGTTPEAKAILTANRDRTFALAIDLHEDHEAEGFYLYETTAEPRPATFAGPVTAALTAAGFPLQELRPDFEVGPPGSEAAHARGPGAIVVDAAAETPYFEGRLPLGLVLIRKAVPYALTFEAPQTRPPAERVAMHRIAVVEALRMLGGERAGIYG